MAPDDAALPRIRSSKNLRIYWEVHIDALASVRVTVLPAVVRPAIAVVYLYYVALAVGRVLAPTVPHVSAGEPQELQTACEGQQFLIDVTALVVF